MKAFLGRGILLFFGLYLVGGTVTGVVLVRGAVLALPLPLPLLSVLWEGSLDSETETAVSVLVLLLLVELLLLLLLLLFGSTELLLLFRRDPSL